MRVPHLHVGTAAWTIPRSSAEEFPGPGSQLERYARRLNAVELNSSFYREHKPETYLRWAAAVPGDFRFSVKLSRVFTHERRLRDPDGLEVSLRGIQGLGAKLGVLLVQLPPSLFFDEGSAGRFFAELRRLHRGAVALEPRHPSWNGSAARELASRLALARVIADPDPCPPPARDPAALAYYRLHGSPVMYRSAYGDARLAEWRDRIARDPCPEAWCIFDNTALGHATADALALSAAMGSREIVKTA